MIHHGDCLDVMATFDAQSVDAIVTDPPYGLGFMGKAWDGTAGPGGIGDMPMRRRAETNIVNTGVSRQGGRQRSTADFARRQARDARTMQSWHQEWAEAAFRVAKPGAHLLAFGGTRTYHRLASAIEDAGWEIRDTLVWAYASGFPKSLNLTGERQGWGTALKPAWEPIVMARKPLRGTVAANVEAHGTGALNIDGCRIPFVGAEAPAGRDGEATAEKRYGDEPGDFSAKPGRRVRVGGGANASSGFVDGYERGDGFVESSAAGRWPANVILTDPIFDGDTPGVVGGGEQSGGGNPRWRSEEAAAASYGGFAGGETDKVPFDQSGTYSRFFLIPKAARSDREPVLGGGPKRVVSVWGGDEDDLTPGKKSTVARRNVHPTVKPTELMRHLVRLVTPPGGTVLDPFLGSGTTALAAEAEGFVWIGIEREAEYVAIAEARLNGTQRGLGLVG